MPGDAATARIQPGRYAQGPLAAAAMRQAMSEAARQTAAMRLGTLAARAAVYRPMTSARMVKIPRIMIWGSISADSGACAAEIFWPSVRSAAARAEAVPSLFWSVKTMTAVPDSLSMARWVTYSIVMPPWLMIVRPSTTSVYQV